MRFKLILFFITTAIYASKTDLSLTLGHTSKIELKSIPDTIYVEDPEVIDYNFNKPSWLLLTAKGVGHTKLYLIDGDKIEHEYKLEVHYPIKTLDNIVSSLFPKSKITFKEIPKHLIVKGYTSSKGLHDKILKQVYANVPEDQVVDKISYPDVDIYKPSRQINLRVRIVEVRRSIAKALGIHWDVVAKRDANSNKFSFTGPQSFSLNSSSTSTALNLTSHTFVGNIFANAITVSGMLDLLEEDNFATTVQEPNLTVKAGESASFSVGGKVPINRPSDSTFRAGTVSYQSYGISLDYSAKFNEEDPNLIELNVTPSVSDVLPSSSNNNPTILEKKAKTVVELRSGQSIAIAGLVASSTTSDKSSVPRISNLPFVGGAFRSENYSRLETEIVFVITPYIVHATQGGMLRDQMDKVGMPRDIAGTTGFIIGETDED